MLAREGQLGPGLPYLCFGSGQFSDLLIYIFKDKRIISALGTVLARMLVPLVFCGWLLTVGICGGKLGSVC